MISIYAVMQEIPEGDRAHVRVRVFGGTQPGSRALLGVLVCSPAEATIVVERLNQTNSPIGEMS